MWQVKRSSKAAWPEQPYLQRHPARNNIVNYLSTWVHTNERRALIRLATRNDRTSLVMLWSALDKDCTTTNIQLSMTTIKSNLFHPTLKYPPDSSSASYSLTCASSSLSPSTATNLYPGPYATILISISILQARQKKIMRPSEGDGGGGGVARNNVWGSGLVCVGVCDRGREGERV